MRPARLLVALTVALVVGCAVRPRWIEPERVPPPAFAARAAKAVTLDVASFNVAGLPRFVTRRDPRETHPRMGLPLGAFDLVLLQEDFWYHDRIAAPHEWRARPRRGFLLQLGDGLARFSRYPLGSVEHVPWGEAHGVLHHYNDRLAAKGFAAGTVELAPGRTLWVYNVHCDAGGDPGDRRAREAQRAQLAAHVADHVPRDAALVVAGDFNAGPGSLEELRAATGLLDAGVGGIDRVLYRSGRELALTPVARDASDALDALRGLSDHTPVHVRFELSWSAAAGPPESVGPGGPPELPSGADSEPQGRTR